MLSCFLLTMFPPVCLTQTYCIHEFTFIDKFWNHWLCLKTKDGVWFSWGGQLCIGSYNNNSSQWSLTVLLTVISLFIFYKNTETRYECISSIRWKHRGCFHMHSWGQSLRCWRKAECKYSSMTCKWIRLEVTQKETDIVAWLAPTFMVSVTL